MRLIDADALTDRIEADKKQDNISPGNFFLFKAYIMNAPTIEPDGDTISRQDAIEAVEQAIFNHDSAIMRITELPSAPSAEAEQVTGKLNNPDDSLLTADSKACKEQKSKLDLISRQDACGAIEHWGRSRGNLTNNQIAELQREIESLPSAESTGAMDEAIQEYIKDGYMQPIGEDLISRQAVIELIKNSYYNLAENMDDVWAMVHDVEQLPSAEVEDRLYIKIYADDEPSVMAEKLYQICGETQNGEVAEWLKEYFPSAPDSRQRGEWVDNHNGTFVCDQCGCKRSKSNFCPNCGADMRGEEE